MDVSSNFMSRPVSSGHAARTGFPTSSCERTGANVRYGSRWGQHRATLRRTRGILPDAYPRERAAKEALAGAVEKVLRLRSTNGGPDYRGRRRMSLSRCRICSPVTGSTNAVTTAAIRFERFVDGRFEFAKSASRPSAKGVPACTGRPGRAACSTPPSSTSREMVAASSVRLSAKRAYQEGAWAIFCASALASSSFRAKRI